LSGECILLFHSLVSNGIAETLSLYCLGVFASSPAITIATITINIRSINKALRITQTLSVNICKNNVLASVNRLLERVVNRQSLIERSLIVAMFNLSRSSHASAKRKLNFKCKKEYTVRHNYY